MRQLIILFALSSSATLSAQTNSAYPAAIAHIRAEYVILEDTATSLEILRLDDGVEVAQQDGNIRRIVKANVPGISKAYYYTKLGNPIFLFVQTKDKEERIYFDPQLEDGPGRLRMIRWVDDEKRHTPDEKNFIKTGNMHLTDAFNLLNRAQGEIEFTAEVYGAICRRLAKIDQQLDERDLPPADTLDLLEAEKTVYLANDGEHPCSKYLYTYADVSGQTLRTLQSSACHNGYQDHSFSTIIFDYDAQGQKLRETDNEQNLLPGINGANWVSATISTYFDDGQAVYELLSSENQGFEVFRRLKILED